MRAAFSNKVESSRCQPQMFPKTRRNEHNGVFRIVTPAGIRLQVLISDGGGWEHVSVSTPVRQRMPTWADMCFIKDLFWDEEETVVTVVQCHPSKSDYVNCHPNCLHLWKPVGTELPRPPSMMVGPVADRQRYRGGGA